MADFDIFNLGVDAVDTHTVQVTSNTEVYKPTADDGKDGTYKALVRFVPNPKNPRNSLVKKYVHWLTDATGEGKLVDSPASIGEKCPIADAFWKLRKSDSAVDRKISEKLKRREQYYALIKIIKDPQNPELEGTYKIFKFGYKIKEKIDAELKPDFGEPTQIFDLFEGKNFELIITRQGEFNNYDKSKFSSSRSPITVDGKAAERNADFMGKIKEEISSAPDLSAYEYQVWDDQTRDFVNATLRQYLTPGGSAMDELTSSSPRKKAAPSKAAADVSEDFDLGMDSTPSPSSSSTPVNADDSDDLDSFLNDLDI
jgi:hypothetical protein